MIFLQVIEKIDKILKLSRAKKNLEKNQPEIQALLDALYHSIRDNHGEGGVALLKQALLGFGLKALVDEDSLVEKDNRSEDALADNKLYGVLLPLCALAYCYEKNGIVEEHAHKLAMVFNKLEFVLDYLLSFRDKVNDSAKQGIVIPLLHDACLFDLPDQAECDFKFWKSLANKDNALYMKNSDFRYILPHASILEKMIIEERNKNPNKKFSQNEIVAKRKAIKVSREQYNVLETTPFSNNPPTAEERKERDDKFKELSQERSHLLRELALLCFGMALENMDIDILVGWYEYYQWTTSGAHRILVGYGISEKNIKLFNKLKRENDDTFVPDLLIEGKDIGYDNWHLRKLDTMSDEGAARGVCLGKENENCQYPGGIGHDAAFYGITSPYAGFYVLSHNADLPTLNDSFPTSALVVSGESNNLVYDSVEGLDTDCSIDMFCYAAEKLVRGEYGIERVTVGAQSGISKKVGLENYPAPKELYRDYYGYSDAKSQLLVADKRMPYLRYGAAKSKKLNQYIEKNTTEFFEEIFDEETPLSQNALLKKAVAFALNVNNQNLMRLMRHMSMAKNRAHELSLLIKVNEIYIYKLNNDKIDFDAIQKGAYIDAMNIKGKSALHIAVLNGDAASIDVLINKGAFVNLQDKHGNTPLINAVETVLYENRDETGRNIAKQLITAGADVDVKDKDENTPLFFAVKKHDFAMVRYLVENGADIETYDADMRTAIYLSALLGLEDIFNYLYEKNAKLNITSYKNRITILMATLQKGHLYIVEKIIAKSSINLGSKDKQGKTLLHYAVPDHLCLRKTLTLITAKKRFAAIQCQDQNGDSVLHKAVHHPDSLKELLESLSDDEKRLQAIQCWNKYGNTVLHKAIGYPDSLRAILESFSSDEKRLEAIQSQNKDGDTVLHKTAPFLDSLKMILGLFSNDEKRFEVILCQDKDGNTVLHKAAPHCIVLSYLLGLYPNAEKRFDAILCQNKEGDTVLHKAAAYPDSLKVILESLSDAEKRFDAILCQNKEGDTVLHKAVAYPDSLKVILESLSNDEQRLEAILCQNKNGDTVLHKAVPHPSDLSYLLGLYPNDEKRLEAVSGQNKHGNTVLHLMALTNPKSLTKMFESFSNRKTRFEAMQCKNSGGRTVFEVFESQLKVLGLLGSVKSFYLDRDGCYRDAGSMRPLYEDYLFKNNLQMYIQDKMKQYNATVKKRSHIPFFPNLSPQRKSVMSEIMHAFNTFLNEYDYMNLCNSEKNFIQAILDIRNKTYRDHIDPNNSWFAAMGLTKSTLVTALDDILNYCADKFFQRDFIEAGKENLQSARPSHGSSG